MGKKKKLRPKRVNLFKVFSRDCIISLGDPEGKDFGLKVNGKNFPKGSLGYKVAAKFWLPKSKRMSKTAHRPSVQNLLWMVFEDF